MDSYDEIPYDSTPFNETHPQFLATLAGLFGIQAADPENCRVLEIGCASGGNLIPMAWYQPGSRFLGIELSAEQARAGAEMIDKLGLDNIEIRQGDILEFPADAGQFDYIIVHGVYSWVPPQVREKILAVCREHLSPNGIAYISYNTLPGWRWRGMLRDMLLYHTRGDAPPGERLARAQDFLAFIEQGLDELESLNARYLREELKRINNSHPSYLYHEYLESFNEPLLFSNFVADANRHGLGYICDVELSSMFSFALGDKIAAWVEQFDDNVAMWQYLDFLSNRNFRQSLLCHHETSVSYDLDMDRFCTYAFHAEVTAPKKLDLRSKKSVAFKKRDGSSQTVHHPLTQAALAYLGERYPAAIGFTELATVAQAMVGGTGNQQAAGEIDHLCNELFSLFAHQTVYCRTIPYQPQAISAEAPRPSRLAQVQNASGLGHVTSPYHAALSLDPFSEKLLATLDGNTSVEECITLMSQAMQSEPALNAMLTEPQRKNPEKLRQSVRANCQNLLLLFARNGILQ